MATAKRVLKHLADALDGMGDHDAAEDMRALAAGTPASADPEQTAYLLLCEGARYRDEGKTHTADAVLSCWLSFPESER
jgi:hypothetical protein